MDKQHISIGLEVELRGETLTGRARNGSGPGRSFAGWLGLLGAIDALIAESGGRRAEAAHTPAEAADPPHPSPPEENQ